MRVVATAGHVDHGKSTLVLALTGTDPDRFPEEKARGLTIDLGFAFTTLPSGQEVGFVDVPGHVRFVKNMLAGVGVVDVAMLVVAANEGWMPQTEEHAQILELLDVRHGLVVVTKAALVDDDDLDLATLQLADRLAATPFASWPVITTDAPTGRGVEDLRRTLDQALGVAPPPYDARRPRLWVDRVFTAKGAGTVVTGTLTGGHLSVGDDVVVEPGNRSARVREIESRHERRPRASPGSRVALNLAGIERAELARGDAVVLPDQWQAASVVDVELRTLPGHALPTRGAVEVHLGTGEAVGRLRVLGDDARFARIWLPRPLPLAPGDRLVIRSSAQQATIAGARVLDVEPARTTTEAVDRLAASLGARVMMTRPWCRPDELGPLAGAGDVDAFAAELVRDGHAVWCGDWLVAPRALHDLRMRAVSYVRDRGAPGVDLATLAAACHVDVARLRAALADQELLIVEHDFVRDASGASLDRDPAARTLVDALAAKPFMPDTPADLGADPAVVRALLRAGTLVDIDGVVFTAEAVEQARTLIAGAVVERGTLSIADVRDLLGSTRKYVLPLVMRMDAEGITRRRGDDRIPGPRATHT
jgi:selenocysteine-specific elongation factor